MKTPPNPEEVRTTIKRIISQVNTDIDPADIPDEVSFKDDLDLDSLALLEIGIAVLDAFEIEWPNDTELPKIQNMAEAVELVREHLAVELA